MFIRFFSLFCLLFLISCAHTPNQTARGEGKFNDHFYENAAYLR